MEGSEETFKYLSREDKSRARRMVIVFLAICFPITWIYEFVIFYAVIPPSEWRGHTSETRIQALGELAMLVPLGSHLIVVLLFGEGPSAFFTHLFSLPRRFTILIAAVVLPLGIYIFVSGALNYSSVPQDGVTDDILWRWVQLGVYPILGLIPCLGEEMGWRAFLLPRLIRTGLDEKLAIVLHGIIWSLWHLPLVIAGFTYGHPFAWWPMFLYTWDSIVLGWYLAYFQLSSGCVWVSTIAHAVNDGSGGPINGYATRSMLAYNIALEVVQAAVVAALYLMRELKPTGYSFRPPFRYPSRGCCCRGPWKRDATAVHGLDGYLLTADEAAAATAAGDLMHGLGSPESARGVDSLREVQLSPGARHDLGLRSSRRTTSFETGMHSNW